MFGWLKKLLKRLVNYCRCRHEQSGGVNTSFLDSETASTTTEIDHHYENLVFEGGGVKGLSLAASVVELERLGIIDDIKRYAGSSAGAIVASGLAIGYTPHEIVKIMVKTDFNKFVDDSFGVVRDMRRLVKRYG